MDILDSAAIRLLCRFCDHYYEVPLRDILLSHEIVHCGCPVPHETECPPVFQIRICDSKVVESLQIAWRAASHCAELAGGELVLFTEDKESGAKHTTKSEQGANDVFTQCT
jgi:hypothetical protein